MQTGEFFIRLTVTDSNELQYSIVLSQKQKDKVRFFLPTSALYPS